MGWAGCLWYGGAKDYAAAILYEVVNGSNSEIWLQDDGGDPVLITTLPQRIALGWSSSLSGTGAFAADTIPMGYLLNPALLTDIIQIDEPITTFLLPDVRSSPPPPIDTEERPPSRTTVRITITDDSKGTAGAAFGISYITRPDIYAYKARDGAAFATRTGYRIFPPSTGLIEHSIVYGTGGNSSTATIHDASNALSAFLQRRQEGTYIYMRHQPYHSETTPVPNLTTGNVWLNAQYWANGTLSTESPTPLPEDITGSVLTNALRQTLVVTQPGSPINGQQLNRSTNFVSTTESISVSLAAFLPTEEGDETTEVNISISRNGGAPVISTQQFPRAPANARQILSVAIYPRG